MKTACEMRSRISEPDWTKQVCNPDGSYREYQFIFLFHSSRSSRLCRAPREISRSPRLAHKAPVMQANTSVTHILVPGVGAFTRVSMGLTDRCKTAKNLVDSRKH